MAMASKVKRATKLDHPLACYKALRKKKNSQQSTLKICGLLIKAMVVDLKAFCINRASRMQSIKNREWLFAVVNKHRGLDVKRSLEENKLLRPFVAWEFLPLPFYRCLQLSARFNSLPTRHDRSARSVLVSE